MSYLSREIMLKRAVINVQTADNACFTWSVALWLKNLYINTSCENRISNELSQIKKFETLNDIFINVYNERG